MGRGQIREAVALEQRVREDHIFCQAAWRLLITSAGAARVSVRHLALVFCGNMHKLAVMRHARHAYLKSTLLDRDDVAMHVSLVAHRFETAVVIVA